MNITHLCFGGPYTDGFSYQDNLLPKYHKRLGNNVTIITSDQAFDSHGNIVTVHSKKNYINEFDVKVIRLPVKKPLFCYKKFRRFVGTYEAIKNSKPDVLFIHGCQFLDIDMVIQYLKENPKVIVFVDNHADFSNSARSFLSYHIVHKVIWKHCAKKILPYTRKFYGVLPARVDFLIDMYDIPKSKVRLLVMGADDDDVKNALVPSNMQEMRKKLGVNEDTFLIMTGGKIDIPKQQTLCLMEAVNKLGDPKIQLIVFGSVVEELQLKVKSLQSKYVHYIGWVNSKDTSQYFAASDLVVFPGRHSVFWEQVAGLGKPMICKYWPGTTHVDVGGNAIFLKQSTTDEIYQVLKKITEQSQLYRSMKQVAETKAKKQFSYMEIAKQSLDFIDK